MSLANDKRFRRLLMNYRDADHTHRGERDARYHEKQLTDYLDSLVVPVGPLVGTGDVDTRAVPNLVSRPRTSITDDPKHPGINVPTASGQNETYLVLSEAERAKGFVRPLRTSYRHVGARPEHPLRDLTDEERHRYGDEYTKFECFPPEMAPRTGHYWTDAELAPGCGAVTTMGLALSETYARDAKFYSATFCVGCGTHRKIAEFVWDADNQVVGS